MGIIVAAQPLKISRRSRAKAMVAFDFPPGSEVRVHREKEKSWERPLKLLSYDGYKTDRVDCRKGLVLFPFSTVLPFLHKQMLYLPAKQLRNLK